MWNVKESQRSAQIWINCNPTNIDDEDDVDIDDIDYYKKNNVFCSPDESGILAKHAHIHVGRSHRVVTK